MSRLMSRERQRSPFPFFVLAVFEKTAEETLYAPLCIERVLPWQRMKLAGAARNSRAIFVPRRFNATGEFYLREEREFHPSSKFKFHCLPNVRDTELFSVISDVPLP